jgi:hypothetical protein
MRKALVFIIVGALTLNVLTAVPAAAHSNFWGGVAIGLGSAFVLGNLFYPPRPYYYPPPAYYYPPPTYVVPPAGRIGYPPPPPPRGAPYRDNWVPGHWEERPGPYGGMERIWVPGYWEERN